MSNTQVFDQPLVSIVVITYNSSKYVIETLESAKAQTYKNIELIVSDDCSPDNTAELCKEWIENNRSRFVRAELVVAQKNSGIPANCNRGIKKANGEWIKIIAGDDILMANCIEAMVSFSINSGSQIATSGIEEFCEDGLPSRVKGASHLRKLKLFSIERRKQFKFYVRNPVFLNSPALIFKKEVFDKIGLFDERFRILEDTPFLIKALHAGYAIHYNETQTVRYRTTLQARDKDLEHEEDFYLCFELCRRPYLSKFNIVDLAYLYDFFLIKQSRNCKNSVCKYVLKVLVNLTDPIFMKNRVSRLLRGS